MPSFGRQNLTNSLWYRFAVLTAAVVVMVVLAAVVIDAQTAESPAAPRPASVAAYRGLGTWVDIWDSKAFDAPEAAVADMASHGVKTIYLETSNSSRAYAIYRPSRQARIIRAAHARGMRVVAWYLPSLEDPALDYRRIKSAIRFRTSDGQRFDSFALDIESSKVKPVSERNTRLLRLSKRIRGLVGKSYPLGAIIPSPAGMEKNDSYWKPFPFAQVARVYDVILPMTYYTYHWEGGDAVYQSMLANMRILRAKETGDKAVHLIGGLAAQSSGSEVRAFVKGSQDATAVGASLYDWSTTRESQWRELKAVAP